MRKRLNPYSSLLFPVGKRHLKCEPSSKEKKKKLKQTRLSASSGLLARTAEVTPSSFCMRCIFSETLFIHVSERVATVYTAHSTAGDSGG